MPGDLYVRGAAAFRDYYKDEGKFRDASRGDWLTVGDIAYRDEEGFYYICDRRTDMIISGGMNIYPAEIEAVLDGASGGRGRRRCSASRPTSGASRCTRPSCCGPARRSPTRS